ncbi:MULTISPECIES: hypothetical protein [unclassified Cryobacterium]|uniref:hypothetical protein n=1 Tax=unclassified Cryobacterium TaxID=2649013 RepID=UPI002AB42BE9|nr:MULTISPECIES: hypothetical protein [unclassified Cryobacterium]MDY7542616.1 hypothetical protein [Cryobacterium sp. 5B3]MEB0264736.1 hypothetical protein [Cryobacterium sp. 10I5]MEB0273708.1 hypothetical protein [Cryobacterium sp. 5B3]
MSVATKAALDAAIQAHFADVTLGGFTTGYVLQVKGKTSEDLEAGQQTSYLREVAESQDSDISLGLMDFMHTKFRQSVGESWVPGDDD